MSSPRKSSRSPARTRSQGRTKTTARSRSRSAGRKPKSVAKIKEPEANDEYALNQVADGKLLAHQMHQVWNSTAGTNHEEATLTKRTVVSASYSSSTSVSSAQEHASVTPFRTSSRIAAILDKEKEELSRLREKFKNEMLSHINTPPAASLAPPAAESEAPSYEFCGPLGAFLIITSLPVILYYTNYLISQDSIDVLPFSRQHIASFFNVEATLIFLAWFFFQAFLALLPIGHVVEGRPLKFGDRLKYRCNGIYAMVISLLLLAGAAYLQLPVTRILEKYNGLITSGILFSFILSTCLLISSRFVSKKKLTPGGCTGNVIYDFFIGRELNPRVGKLDLKFFLEMRPGLIGWLILDWIMVIKAFQMTGTFLPSLVLVALFHSGYIIDAFLFEDGFLTTLEITDDGCGFMLVFGSLAWLPFFYSLPARYLSEKLFTLPWYCLAPITLLYIVGFYIYRQSQVEKYRFRNPSKYPTDSELASLPTQTKRRLLIAGFWGICRKPMYLGDLMLTLSWSLATGFGSIVPYCYFIYLLIFLIYRERRDDARCREKYGASWDCYCERVKYRIFPYIY